MGCISSRNREEELKLGVIEEQTTKRTTEKLTEQTSEQTIHATKQITEWATEEKAERVTEQTTEGTTKQTTQQITEQAIKQAERTTEQATKQTTEQPTKEVEYNETTEKRILQQMLRFDDIREELNNVTMEKRTVFCDLCVYKLEGKSPLRVVKKEGVHICYGCELTLCKECVKGHEGYKFCVYKDSNERGKMREKWINILIREPRREDELEKENVCIYDRVNVKHEWDIMDCNITGLCGLDNRRWAASDFSICCIKIFRCGSNVLLRYLRIGSGPWDVTEIKIKHTSTVPDLASSSASSVSVADSPESDKHCLLAVTIPRERHILFIDVNKTPAIKVKNIKMEKECYGIKFCDQKIFTVCNEDPSLYNHWSVYVMSTDGDQLSILQTGINSLWPDLAVAPGRVYLTDMGNNKVMCIGHVDGEVISEITIKGSGPRGIIVDPDYNVYISALGHDRLYKLNFDLDGPPQPLLLDESTDYMERPRALCFYKDKLFVSHYWRSPLRNIVSVVSLV